MTDRYDLAKLRRLQRQRDSLAARGNAISDLLQAETEAARFYRQSLHSQFMQAQAMGRCVAADFDDVPDWSDDQMKAEGLSPKTRTQWRDATEAADAYRRELAGLNQAAAPLRRLVAACERLVPSDAVILPGVVKKET